MNEISLFGAIFSTGGAIFCLASWVGYRDPVMGFLFLLNVAFAALNLTLALS